MPGMMVRIGHALLTMAAMAFIAFGLLHLLGDPIENMAGQEVSAETRSGCAKRSA